MRWVTSWKQWGQQDIITFSQIANISTPTVDFDDNASDSKSFNYKTKIIGKTVQRPARLAQLDPLWNGTQPSQPPPPAILPLNTEAVVLLKFE